MQKNALRASAARILASLTFLTLTPCASAVDVYAMRLAELEKTSGGRLGVYAIDTGSGRELGHRAEESFPMCSTFKAVLVAAVLQRSLAEGDFLAQQIAYAKSDLVTYSPVTEKHETLSVAELCAAAMQYSDNTAANLLIKLLGEPGDVTAYARRIGNETFRLDRMETELNTAIPGDPRDTVSPRAMARSLQAVTLGDALPPAQREQMSTWLRGNTTGAKRIRAGTPAGWQVGDKTGSCGYGTGNDIAVLWPPDGQPIFLALYHTHDDAEAKRQDDVLVSATRIVIEAFTAGAEKSAR